MKNQQIREPARVSTTEPWRAPAVHGYTVTGAIVALVVTGKITAAFDRRGIPAGGVSPPSNMLNALGRRALPPGRLIGLGALP